MLYIFAIILCAVQGFILGRVARYTPSSDFGMQLQNSTQYDGN